MEFEEFIDELKEFFNAMDLNKLLLALAKTLEESKSTYTTDVNKCVEDFLRAKKKAHLQPLACIKQLTALRQSLIKLKKIKENKSLLGYSWNADFKLEDYLFVILGDFLNSVSTSIVTKDNLKILLDVVLQVLINMKYSDYDKNECDCIANSVSRHIQNISEDPLYYLRVKSTIDRSMRLIRHFSNTICNAYQSTVRLLIS